MDTFTHVLPSMQKEAAHQYVPYNIYVSTRYLINSGIDPCHLLTVSFGLTYIMVLPNWSTTKMLPPHFGSVDLKHLNLPQKRYLRKINQAVPGFSSYSLVHQRNPSSSKIFAPP
jgi:hypothetical protein